MLGFDRITFNPRIMAGQACILGMRIPVSLIVNLVANGKQVEEILEEYPDLEPEDIKQSLLYAATCENEGRVWSKPVDRFWAPREVSGVPTVFDHTHEGTRQ